MGKVKQGGALFLILLLVVGTGVSVKANEDDWEAKEWGKFWGNVAAEFIKNLKEADQTSTLRVQLKGIEYIYYTSADPVDEKTEIYYTLEMGEQKRRMPDEEGYWAVEPGEKIRPQDEYGRAPEVSLSVPAFQSSYQVLIKTWDYDPVGNDDLLGWAIVEYNRYSSNISFVNNSPNPRTAIKIDFALD